MAQHATMRLALSALLASSPLFFLVVTTTAQVTPTQYVYYGYVPLSSNIGAGVPTNRAILDITGTSDGTKIEIWDLTTKILIGSNTINRLENYTLYILFLTYFKIVSNKPVSAVLLGGSRLSQGSSGINVFYPSIEGGYAGTEFYFMAMPRSYELTSDIPRSSNCWIFALEDTVINVVDSAGTEIAKDKTVKQNGYYALQLNTIWPEFRGGGAGKTTRFRITSTRPVMVSSNLHTGIVFLQAIGGGYVGKLFIGVPTPAQFENPTRESYGAYAIFPYEACKVSVYKEDGSLEVERTFTADDIARGEYLFRTVNDRKLRVFSSTGKISVMVGGTSEGSTIDYFGDDIALAGTIKGEELRFYAPTEAVIFAPGDMDVTVDGKMVHLVKDGFQMLDRGFHTVKATETVIVQTVGGATRWLDWGKYLISTRDVEQRYEAPSGFTGIPPKSGGYEQYIIIAAVIAVAAAVVARKKILRRKT